MLLDMLIRLIEVSIPVSIIILIVAMATPLVEKRYSPRLMRYMMILILIRLLAPIQLSVDSTSINIDGGAIVSEVEMLSSQLFEDADTSIDKQDNNDINSSTRSMTEMIALIWISGFIIILVYNISRYFLIQRRVHSRTRSSNDDIRMIFEEVVDELDIKRDIELRVTDANWSPMLIGIIKPIVVIPDSDYSQIELYLIIKHELTHYKQHDLIIKLMMLIARSVYWFNPLVYTMSRLLNESIEMACDELVVYGKKSSYKKIYMDTILSGIERSNYRNPLVSNYNGGVNNMKRRFNNIASKTKSRGLIILVLFVILIIGLFSFIGCDIKRANDVTVVDKPIDDRINTQEEAILGYKSEDRDGDIEKAIIEELRFGIDEQKGTRYYYNYIDLNDDGKDEAIVLLVGMYTSGSGGSTALIMEKDDNRWSLRQQLTLINPPIIISDNTTDGWKDIIVYRSGGGIKGGYVKLESKEGLYPSVNDGVEIDTLDGITGKAIINNDLAQDLQNGSSNYLAK